MRARDGLARRAIQDVGRQPGEVGLLDALLEDAQTEVELVVAERGVVDAQAVEGLDHLLALEGVGHHRGREQVAREQYQRVRVEGHHLVLDGGDGGSAAAGAAVDALQLVDVVEGHRGGVGEDGGEVVGDPEQADLDAVDVDDGV
ncbi:MAG: hypothetical protein P8Y02_11945, partial [Deinococcales bacterium]